MTSYKELKKIEEKLSKAKRIGHWEGAKGAESGQIKTGGSIYDEPDHPAHKDLDAHGNRRAAHYNTAEADKHLSNIKAGISRQQAEYHLSEYKRHLRNAAIHAARANDLSSKKKT